MIPDLTSDSLNSFGVILRTDAAIESMTDAMLDTSLLPWPLTVPTVGADVPDREDVL
jgi:hypothetical protein